MNDRLEPAASAPGGPDLRLLPAAVTAWIAAAVAVTDPQLATALGLGSALLVTFAIAIAARRPQWRAAGAMLVLALSAAALVSTSAAVRGAERLPDAVQESAAVGKPAQIAATVTALPRASGASVRLRAQLVALNDEAVAAPVLLFVPTGDDEPPPIGALISLRGNLQLADPGDRVVALVFAREPADMVARPHPLLEAGDLLRGQFLAAAQPLPGPGNMLVPGLAVGDERLVNDALDDDMRVASLSHLTAVSGSNIALIVAGMLALGRLAAWPRAVRLGVAALALALFVLLVTPQGSVIRAAAMGLIVLAVDAVSRPVSGVPVLALAVIVLLAADPWLARDYGFALSSAATAGLLLGTRPAQRLLERWLPPSIALLIAVPLVAQLACQPILLLLDPQVQTYGVLANLLAAPAAPLATVAGLLGCLIGALVPPLGMVLLWVAWLPAQWIGLVAQAVAGFPLATVPWLPGAAGALLFVLLIAAVVVVVQKPPGGKRARLLRQLVAFGLSAAVVIAAAGVAFGVAVLRRDLPQNWRVAVCDVGQGDALLLQSDGRHILIDTGESIDLLASCLERFAVTEIDLLIVSHFDRDHIGALRELTVPVREAWVPDTEQARVEPDTQLLHSRGVLVRFAAAGDQQRRGEFDLQVLSPKRRGAAPSRTKDNDGSLVVLARPNQSCRQACYSLLLLGDAGETRQRAIAKQWPSLRADLLKVSHHGSADQSAELTSQVRARLAFISVGADNSYGHPTSEAFAALEAAGTPWLRTDQRGSFAVYEQHGQLQIWAERRERTGCCG
ncbi:DNA internalization-related competence protein ComEC/Rec2 [Gulosibacter sp. GYB002]|uniref:DNA internalization-related competence protein ComEC/Rec2 n=1 Tax=Gulosibacter sp. GYB002 TaxID=2994391 RepID=UPI002F966AD5